jgi:hypothetical protein
LPRPEEVSGGDVLVGPGAVVGQGTIVLNRRRSQRRKRSKRMMGLEPTTFCMASGSWVRLFEIAIAVFMWRSMISAHTRCSAGTAGFQGIPSGLGTNVGLVPKRILRRNRLATAECSEWLHILMSVRRRLLRVGLPRALMGRASSNRPSIGLVSTGHARQPQPPRPTMWVTSSDGASSCFSKVCEIRPRSRS